MAFQAAASKAFKTKVVYILVFYSFTYCVNSQALLSRVAAQFTPCPTPPRFPQRIRLQTSSFESYSRDIKIPAVLLASPKSEDEILSIVNWAFKEGYRVRAAGGRHNFSPFLFSQTDAGRFCPNIILMDMTAHFNSMQFINQDESPLSSVIVGTGVKLLQLLTYLEDKGHGLFASPAIPSVSVGGLLATGTHGSGVKYSELDSYSPGHTGGSLSNLILEMTIVAWDEASSQYVLKTIHRSDKDCKAFLVHLGRSVVTSVKLRVGRNQNLRTTSHFYIRAKDLYANPEDAPSPDLSKTLAGFVEKYGRVDAISLPTTKYVWLMTWHEETIKPASSRLVSYPFNYYFMNYVPVVFDHITRFFVTRIPSISKLIGTFGYLGSWLGVLATWSGDYWGLSKNHLLYVSPYTPHLAITGFAVLTSRKNLQKVTYLARHHYEELEREYGSQLLFPISGGSDIRISGIDDPADVGIEGAEAASLSASRKSEEYPDYDTVVWMDLASFLGTPKRVEFLYRMQSAMYDSIHKSNIGIIRPEWSKQWAFTAQGPFQNQTIIVEEFPKVFSSRDDDGWKWTIQTLDRYDPHKVFSNDFLDNLLKIS